MMTGMINMKRKIVVICAIAICLAIASLGTIAYFTAEDTATNVITTGGVDIELKEMADKGQDGLVPFEDETGVMPGAEISKIVTVKNTGSADAYIRIKLEKSIVLSDEVEAPEGFTPDASLVSYDLNTADWTEKDGYFYYNNSLKAGEETTPLFTKVSFSVDMDNIYQQSTAKIDVKAYATQVANNGDSAVEAAGWPA